MNLYLAKQKSRRGSLHRERNKYQPPNITIDLTY